MPAAELTRLRAQINGLIGLFDDPASFRSALRNLLEIYANRAYRPGEAIKPQPLLPSYRVPPLVTHVLEQELSKTCQEQPEQALKVVDALWHDPNLEPRLLATKLLGAIPASHAQEVIQVIKAWAQPNENFRILDALFKDGVSGLRRSAPDLLLGLVEEWMGSSRVELQSIGIRSLIPLIQEPGFENLPPIFRMLGPLLQTTPPEITADLQAVMEALSRRSPTETAYFLRQTLTLSTGPATARLVRRCLPFFNSAQQDSLRVALQAAGQRK
jgi:hypothetical protein